MRSEGNCQGANQNVLGNQTEQRTYSPAVNPSILVRYFVSFTDGEDDHG